MSNDNARTAHRMIAIFDLFARRKGPLTSQDIGDAIDCPKSSLSSLLRVMVAERVLNVDRASNTYFPSPRVVGFADWVMPRMFGETTVEQTMEELRARTSETVVLTVRNDLQPDVIKVLDGQQAVALNIRPGYRFDLWHSAVGEAMLSAMPDRTIYALIRRVNRQAETTPLNTRVVMRAVKDVRSRGFAIGYGRVLPDVGALAAPLPFGYYGRELVISVGGPEQRVRRHEAKIEAALLDAIDRLGDEAKSVNPDARLG